MKIMIDTNILISAALFPDGLEIRILRSFYSPPSESYWALHL